MSGKGAFDKVRMPVAPPSKNHGDKTKHTRKIKHKGKVNYED